MGHTAKSDPVQEAMGPMGLWQIIIIIALSLKGFPAAWNQLAISVIAPGQDFTCISPVPIDPNDSMLRACSVQVNDSLPEVKCNQFTYDDSVFKSTIISEWDLVCDRKFLLSLVQPSTQLGILIGNLVFGIVADKIGRKTPLIIAVVIQLVAGIMTALMPIFELFLLLKFLSAIATGGAMLITYTIAIEIVGKEIRSNILILFHVPFILGFLSVPALSYVTRTWDGYWLAITVPTLLLLSYYWVVPESPRWLFAVGRVEQARQVLLEAAKRNKISSDKVTAAIESQKQLLASNANGIEVDGKRRTYSIIDLVRTPNMRIKTLCIVFNCFKGGLVYFGIAHYLGHMSKNVLTNLAISAVFQLPGLLLVYILISRVSRLKIMIGANVASGISLLLIIPFYDNETVKLVLVTIGIMSMTVGTPTFHLYAGEMFPTVVRSIGFAVCSVAAKLGSIVAPFLIDYIDDIAFWIVPLIFGLGPIIGAILCYWLPETMNCNLPETIEDGENFKKIRRQTPSASTI